MRNYFTLGGQPSTTWGVYISGQGTFGGAQRTLNWLEVPGRSGDMIGLDTRLQMRELVYPAFIKASSSFETNLAGLRAYLLSDAGYRRLTDTYHPDELLMAAYAGPFSPDLTRRNNAAQFDLVFRVKPQRFLTSGETQMSDTGGGSITNPTRFPAKPLLRVYGAGTIGVGSVALTITSNPFDYIDIDCDICYAYSGSSSANSYVSSSSIDFPVLVPGANGVTLSSGVSQLKITPRWWTV